MYAAFTPAHRGGSGEPLVLLHGFLDTWRVWELVLPALERRHDVLALTLAGHAGGPPIDGEIRADVLAAAVETAMDDAGWDTAHIAGNSLGGFVALQLAARGRARSVVALAPAGGWAPGDPTRNDVFELQRRLHEQLHANAANADAIAATAAGRRQATQLSTVNFEHIPPELVAHMLVAIARCDGAPTLIDNAFGSEWKLDAEWIECPVRIVWGSD